MTILGSVFRQVDMGKEVEVRAAQSWSACEHLFGSLRRCAISCCVASPFILYLPSLALAESAGGNHKAEAHLAFRLIVPPVVRMLGCTDVEQGRICQFWTNKSELNINGKTMLVRTAGPISVFLPADHIPIVVHGL